ncbi:Transcription factor jumonji [Metarhizium brunneum]
MTELEAKINKIESLLTSVQSQLERLATKGRGRQKRKSRSRPLRTPEWEAITKAFSELRRDVEDTKKAITSQESDNHSQTNG